MADEITINTYIALSNGNLKVTHTGSVTVDQTTAAGGNPGTVDVGTTEEVIALGDITTPGYAFIRNLDTTNFVEWGPTSAGNMVVAGRLKAGEIALLRLDPAISLRMKADTANCLVLVSVLDD